MAIIKTDRSRIEAYERCPALRFWAYEFKSPSENVEDGEDVSPSVGGIQSSKPIWPLITGGAVHKGLECLLQGESLDYALQAALAEFEARGPVLEGQTDTPRIPFDDEDGEDFFNPFNSGQIQESDYQRQENRALVEALVRVYAMAPTGLQWLLETYEIMAIEEEIEWDLGIASNVGQPYPNSVKVMSRPDAILRSKRDRGLYALSFKTAKDVDSRTLEQLKYDNQGVSELLAIEAKYQEPVRGVQMVYLLKGASWKDDFGIYKSTSPLIRPYCMPGMSLADNSYMPKYEYVDETGKTRRVGKGFKRVSIWENGQLGIEGWMQRMSQEFPGILADQVSNLPPIFRNNGDVRRWVVANYHRERDIRARIELAHRNSELGVSKLETLDALFPMNRKSCVYPSPCSMLKICHEGIGEMLLEGRGLEEFGLKERLPNHPNEVL